MSPPPFAPTMSDPVDSANESLTDRRNHLQQLVELASHLPPDERRLVEMTRGDGRSVRRVAMSLGHCPRALQRRLKRILDRLRDPVFAFLVIHRDLLPLALRIVGDHIILQGCTLHETAQRTRQSLHTVRHQLTALRALASAGRQI